MRRDRATPGVCRRRFLKITASACGVLVAGLPATAGAAALTQWRGVALGAGASITLRHRDADRIISACRAEIDRLEDIFSLYRPGSALSHLNAAGRLDDPPFEMLELLGLCGAIHAATAGLFDPTIQPLWAVYAESHAQGVAPTPSAIDAALSSVGWDGVRVTANRVGFVRDGMALTLTGIAQGYIADRVANLLRAEGLTDVLVNTGEFHALGGHPDGGGWPVMLDEGLERPAGPVELRDMAVASSAPLGTIFDREGRIGHILHPVTGVPATSRWRLVSVVARTAALADGLTTAMCLMSLEKIDQTLGRFPHARLAHLA
jgi:thiamine biosynthesis lipoprotein